MDQAAVGGRPNIKADGCWEVRFQVSFTDVVQFPTQNDGQS